MKLTCDICGGELQMNGGNGATCMGCGINYSIESLRNKLNVQPKAEPACEQPIKTEPVCEQKAKVETPAADEDIPFADFVGAEDDAYVQGASASVPKPEPVMQELIFERKFDIAALTRGVAILVDGEQVAFLTPKITRGSVPISQGEHRIGAVVTYGLEKVEGNLDETIINVTDHNWCVRFSLHRGAFTADWRLEIVEDVEDFTKQTFYKTNF